MPLAPPVCCLLFCAAMCQLANEALSEKTEPELDGSVWPTNKDLSAQETEISTQAHCINLCQTCRLNSYTNTHALT